MAPSTWTRTTAPSSHISSSGSGKNSTASASLPGSGDKSANTYGYHQNASAINRPLIAAPYKRIACIRYTRPMVADGCWAPGPPMCGPPPPPYGYPYPYGYDPYYCGGYPGGFQAAAPRALIIPPRIKNLFRPAREEDFVSSLKIFNDCSPPIRELSCGEGPKYNYPPQPPPPPPPPPPPKPRVDRSKIVKKYLHDAKSSPPRKIRQRGRRMSISPPPKEKKKHHPPKEKKKSPPPKKEKKKSPPPKEEKKKTPPPKEETKPPSVKSVKSVKEETKPPSVKEEKPPPPVAKKPSPMPPKSKIASESSKSSADSDKKYHFQKRKSDEREHHFYADVARRDSSFEAVTKAAKHIKNPLPVDAVAPQRRKK